VALFAYGFGFGGPLLALGLEDPAEEVQDLFRLRNRGDTTLRLDFLADNWSVYRRHFNQLSRNMLGSTPMREGLAVVRNRLSRELASKHYTGAPILFFLSDGMPNVQQHIRKLASQLRKSGVIIVSCFVTSDTIAEPRRLYGHSVPSWPPGARLMYDCASDLPSNSAFSRYLTEHRWKLDPKAKLFSQINQSDLLSEYMGSVLSPLSTPSTSGGTLGRVRNLEAKIPKRHRLFISYSHQDQRWLAAVRQQLGVLERAGLIDIFDDTRLQAGEDWRDRLDQEMTAAKVALLLVSATFLDSDFILAKEVPTLFREHEKAGMLIYPLLLRPCAWEEVTWLSRMQIRPPGAKAISMLRGASREQALADVARDIATLLRKQRSGRQIDG